MDLRKLRHKRDCVKPGIGVWLSCLGRANSCKCVVYVNLPSAFQKLINEDTMFFYEKIVQVLNSTVSL